MKTVFAGAFLCWMLASGIAAAKTPGEVEIGGMLRDAEMTGLSGRSQKLSEFRGMPLVINVWASWCGPCRQEMGSLDRLAKRFGGKHFRVIGISTDDYADLARAALRESKVGFVNFIDRQLMLENMLGADRIPLTLLVDAQGRILAKVYGAQEWDSPGAISYIGKHFGIRF